jgi:hypothetical protein
MKAKKNEEYIYSPTNVQFNHINCPTCFEPLIPVHPQRLIISNEECFNLMDIAPLCFQLPTSNQLSPRLT